MYSGMLTTDSRLYHRVIPPSSYGYYYEAIEMNVSVSGTYSLTSSSSVDTYGFIYTNSFNPINPRWNLLSENDDGGVGVQFKLTIYLQREITYILVVTTFATKTTGAFLVVGSGPASITFTDIITLRTSKNSKCLTAHVVVIEGYFLFSRFLHKREKRISYAYDIELHLSCSQSLK
jgi:hypothetical protein